MRHDEWLLAPQFGALDIAAYRDEIQPVIRAKAERK